MKRVLTFLLLFSACFLIFPLNSIAAETTLKSSDVYGINSISITDDEFTISGWAYITFKNFCNTDNSTYQKYEMTDKNGKSLGIAADCKNKGFNNVVYKIKALGEDGDVVYAKNSSGGENLRRQGISATCVNYYKPTASDGKSSVHCDGATALFGEFPTNPINYKRRNYNVQYYDTNFFYEGAYFYDDIGFAGKIRLEELKNDVNYTLYLEVTVNNEKTHSYKIATTGLVISYYGYSLKSSTAKNFKISSSFYDLVVNHSSNIGTINQSAGAVYYKSSNAFKQKSPSLNGGYFKEYKNYTIKEVVSSQQISIVGNRERFGSFSLYNLGTTGSFNNQCSSNDKNKNCTIPGDNYSYYAISPWVSFSGQLVIKKSINVKSECGGTTLGTTERTDYCNSSIRPDDYNSCCQVCDGTVKGTIERERYCANNPSDSTCCDTVGQCPSESYDDLNPAVSKYYTYWDTSVISEKSFTSSYSNGTTTVDNYPKYCSGTDSTSTMITTDGMLLQYNNAFCYQKGSFTTTSPNQSDYILTYSGGAYSLNVDYNTELVCVSLKNRKVTNVKYYDENCNYKGQANNDGEIHFLDDGYSFGSRIDTDSETFKYWTMCSKTVYPDCSNAPAGSNCPSSVSVEVPCLEEGTYTSDFKYKTTEFLKYNRLGKFNIVDFENKLKEIPSLYLTDNTSNQTVSKFETTINVQKNNSVKTYTENNNSEMLEYIEEQKNIDPSFSDPLGGTTKTSFVQKLQLVRNIDNFLKRTRSFFSVSYSCNSVRCEPSEYTYTRCENAIENVDKTYRYAIDHYYGNLDLEYSDVSDSECNDAGTTCRYYCKYEYWYKGDVTKTMYVTIEDSYKEENMNLVANYTLSSDSVPASIKERFEITNEKYVSQVNLSDYYQITMRSTDYDKDKNSGKYFGIAETWNMDKALCALDLTDHDCDPAESTCTCKYNGASLEKGVYYSECLDFRVVSTTSLFPGKGNYKCENPLRLCRQPGRNWSKYLETGLLSSDNIDYVKDKPMYHIVLTPSAMNNIINNNKDYYTKIDLTGYNPSKCTYAGDSRCSYDYWSTMLNGLDSSVFTRNYDIINLRYRQLKALGANEYKTSKIFSSGGE